MTIREVQRTLDNVPSPVRAGEVYTKAGLCQRLNWGKDAWREAVANGLEVLRVGKCAYISADSVIKYLKQRNKQQKANRP